MLQQSRVLFRPLRIHQWKQIRSSARVYVKTAEDNTNVHPSEWENAKPTSDIPGPTKFELIRGFMPGGIYYKKPFDTVLIQCREMYGDILVIPGVFGQKGYVFTYNPDDFATVIRSEGVWPKRRGLGTSTYYREVHRAKDFGDVIGLIASNDETWAKLRNSVNPILMQPRNARLYLNKLLAVSEEFLERIREIRNPDTLEMPEDFVNEITRYTFESITVVALDHQIGIIRKNRHDNEINNFFVNVRKVLDLSLALDIYPSIWKIIKTPKFYELMKVYDNIFDFIMKNVNQALARIESNPSAENEESVLGKLLKMDKKVAVVMAFDMMLGGVENSSSTLSGILLCIAKNPEKQEKLHQEIRAILPQKDSKLTLDNMKDLPYLRACIKEGMRIYPLAFGGIRCNAEDIVISGYRVPKNSDILMCSHMLLMEDKYCPKAKDFIPERWLRSEKDSQVAINPFMHIPFGFGPRSCVGMRIIQLELEIALAKLVRNFYVEFNYPTENAFKYHFLNVPAIPLKFQFKEVES